MTETRRNVRALLAARRAELAAASDGSAADRRPVELDQQAVGRLSRMDSLQQQAMAQASEDRRAREIQRIEAALMRLEEDDYGFCLSCGEEIADSRLRFDPAASLCIACARRAES